MSSRKRYAYLMGSNGPQARTSMLKYAEKDAMQLAEALVSYPCGFTQVEWVVAESRNTTLSSLQRLARQCEVSDLFLVHFSGHAIFDDQLYLLCNDTDVDDLVVSAIEISSIKRILQRCKARQKVLILDCSHAGSTYPSSFRNDQDIRFAISEQFQSSASVVLAASSRRDQSRELDALEGGFLSSSLAAACTSRFREVSPDGFSLSLMDVWRWLPHALNEVNSGLAKSEQLASPILLSEFEAGYGGDIWLTEQERVKSDITRHNEQEERLLRLKALIFDSDGFIRDRLESFVGRQLELEQIRQYLQKMMQVGGYVFITGPAGQGKSSIIAKLVEEFGIENAIFHFMPFHPDSNHHVILLRDLMARLILKYELSDLYVALDNFAALRDFFPMLLTEVVAKGGQEIIFIDGVDQLKEDANSIRDFSFLPDNPPPGIVFVLGMRSDDAFRQLESLTQGITYQLPNFSRSDFDRILLHRGVHLERYLADQFYEIAEKNALYLYMLAKELGETKSFPIEVLQHLVEAPQYILAPPVTLLKEPATLERFTNLAGNSTNIVTAYATDLSDILRAEVARWIIAEYYKVGRAYEHILLEQLSQDKSEYVQQAIVDAVTLHSEKLPEHIRSLAFRIGVGIQVDIEVLKGLGMLVNKEEELVLLVKNPTDKSSGMVTIELQGSAEYYILSPNPVSFSELKAEGKREVRFQLKVKTAGRIPVNYKINGAMQDPPLYIIAIKDNPYFYGRPVHEVGFFGREEELDEILQAVMKPSKQDILIVGERRIGKTSLLNQVKKYLVKPFIPIYISLNTFKPKTEHLIEGIRSEIIHTLIEYSILDLTWREHRFPYNHFERNISEIIHAAAKNVEDIKLVLLLDEADYMLKVEVEGFRHIIDALKGIHQVDERIQNILRATLQSEIGGSMRAVVAGTTDLATYTAQRSSPFYNHFHEIALKPLTEEETHELILRPASILGYSYAPQVVERITELSGGHPFCCQGLCYEVFRQTLEAQSTYIGSNELIKAEKKVIYELFSKYYLPSFWQRATSRERNFLVTLAQGKPIQGIPTQHVKRLLDWQLIIESSESFTFSAELFKIWTDMAVGRR